VIKRILSDMEKVVKDATSPDDSDSSDDNFKDSSDQFEGPEDFNKPEDWKDRQDDTPLNENQEHTDSIGHSEDSPDYVDEDVLKSWEESLSVEELEQRRLEGVGYKLEGNSLYTEGKPLEACDKYTKGLRVCPLRFQQDRAVLYANRGQMKKVLELNDHAIKNCTKAIELNPKYLKAILRRAEVYEETDKLDEALKDYQSVIEIDPRHVEANKAVRRLPSLIEQRNEKLKEEMFDNLKKLGNMCLKPFGLSTDNFKMEQDPSTGSYNINFSQNK